MHPWLRIILRNVPTFLQSASSPRVRLRSTTNTQGLPSHRLAISPSLNAGMHVPLRNLPLAGVNMSPLPEQPFTAWVGIDWADTKHDICVQATGAPRREPSCIAHRVAAIDEWANALHRRFGGPIAVALELARGPIVAALQKYHFLVLFPINPATLAKYREAFQPSGAKNDPGDAELA